MCSALARYKVDDSVLLSLLLRLLLLLLQSNMMDSFAPKSMHKFACNADFLMRHTKAKPRQYTQTDLDDRCGVRGLASMQQVADLATNSAQQKFLLSNDGHLQHTKKGHNLGPEPVELG